MSSRLVLDAQPLVALLAGEPSADRIARTMSDRAGRGDLLICAVNWCELLYVTRARRGAADAARAAALIQSIPVLVVDADAEIAGVAAALKADFGLGIGDSFAAALAVALGAPLLTGDTDFLPLAGSGLRIEWVG